MSKEKNKANTGALVGTTEAGFIRVETFAKDVIDEIERKEDNVQILGDNISEEDEVYFERFGNSLADQMEVVALESNLDSETMRNEFEELINNINNLTEDNAQYYIVETAQLVCS